MSWEDFCRAEKGDRNRELMDAGEESLINEEENEMIRAILQRDTVVREIAGPADRHGLRERRRHRQEVLATIIFTAIPHPGLGQHPEPSSASSTPRIC
jgi:hypothetical protein